MHNKYLYMRLMNIYKNSRKPEKDIAFNSAWRGRLIFSNVGKTCLHGLKSQPFKA